MIFFFLFLTFRNYFVLEKAVEKIISITMNSLVSIIGRVVSLSSVSFFLEINLTNVYSNSL